MSQFGKLATRVRQSYLRVGMLPFVQLVHHSVMAAASTRVEPGRRPRSNLLDAAIRRFSRSGPDASFDLIAADVGLTKGALYHHFGSKEALVEEGYKEPFRRHGERAIPAI